MEVVARSQVTCEVEVVALSWQTCEVEVVAQSWQTCEVEVVAQSWLACEVEVVVQDGRQKCEVEVVSGTGPHQNREANDLLQGTEVSRLYIFLEYSVINRLRCMKTGEERTLFSRLQLSRMFIPFLLLPISARVDF